MYCKHCGSEIPDTAKYCPLCGKECGDNYFDELPQTAYNYNGQEKDNAADTGRFAWAVLGFFFPIVGFILYFVMRKDKPRTAKKLLIGAIVGAAVYVTLSFIFNLIANVIGAVGGVDIGKYVDIIRDIFTLPL